MKFDQLTPCRFILNCFSTVYFEYKNIASLFLIEMAMISNFPVLRNQKVKMDYVQSFLSSKYVNRGFMQDGLCCAMLKRLKLRF